MNHEMNYIIVGNDAIWFCPDCGRKIVNGALVERGDQTIDHSKTVSQSGMELHIGIEKLEDIPDVFRGAV